MSKGETPDASLWLARLRELLALPPIESLETQLNEYGKHMESFQLPPLREELTTAVSKGVGGIPDLFDELTKHPTASLKDLAESSLLNEKQQSEIQERLKETETLAQLCDKATKQYMDAFNAIQEPLRVLENQNRQFSTKWPLKVGFLDPLDDFEITAEEMLEANQDEKKMQVLVDKLQDVVTKHRDEMTKVRKKFEQQQAELGKLAPVFDAQENNPERAIVVEKLKSLRDLAGSEPSSPEEAAKAFQQLAELESLLTNWQDRRSSQGLPPHREGAAIGDLVQKAYQQLIGKLLEEKWPLPLASDDRKDEVELLWKEIVDKSSKSGFTCEPPNLKQLTKLKEKGHEPTTLKESQQQQFQVEMLTNLARLLQTKTGRDVLLELKKLDHQIKILPGKSPGNLPDSTGAYLGSSSWESCGGSTLLMPLGLSDSDYVMTTEQGETLPSPSPVVMGHELIHALHSARRQNQTLALHEIPEWENLEEYETIHGFELSEQTLRFDLGLTGERFGHIERVQRDGLGIASEMLTASSRLVGEEGSLIEKLLRERNFPPELLDARQQCGLFDVLKSSELKGPLPSEWQLSELSAEQIVGLLNVLQSTSLKNRLPELGWKPFGLAVTGGARHPCTGGLQSIVSICTTGHYHPRSATGRKYVALGGYQAYQHAEKLKKHYLVELAPFEEDDWPKNLEILQSFVSMAKSSKSVDQDLRNHAAGALSVGDLLAAIRVWEKVIEKKEQERQYWEKLAEEQRQIREGLKPFATGLVKFVLSETTEESQLVSEFSVLQKLWKEHEGHLSNLTNQSDDPENMEFPLFSSNDTLAERKKSIQNLYNWDWKEKVQKLLNE